MVTGDLVGGAEFLRPVIAVGVDFHIKSPATADHFLTDPAQPDHANFLLPQFVARKSRPFAGTGGDDRIHQIPNVRQHETKRVLGDRGVIHAGRKKNRDTKFLAGAEIDFIKANAVFADDLEARLASREDRMGNVIISAEKSVEFPGQFEHAELRQRAALADDVIALALQQRMMRAGSVLITGSGKEDAFHGRCDSRGWKRAVSYDAVPCGARDSESSPGGQGTTLNRRE